MRILLLVTPDRMQAQMLQHWTAAHDDRAGCTLPAAQQSIQLQPINVLG